MEWWHFLTTRTRTWPLSMRILRPSPGGGSHAGHQAKCCIHEAAPTPTAVVSNPNPLSSPSSREAQICLEQQDAHPKGLLSQAPLQLWLTMCPMLANERVTWESAGGGAGVFEEAFWLKLLLCNRKEQPQPVHLSHPSPSWNVGTISGGVQPFCDHAEDGRARSRRSPSSQPVALPQSTHTPFPGEKLLPYLRHGLLVFCY